MAVEGAVTYALLFVSAVVLAATSTSNNTDCSAWEANASEDVIITSGSQWRFGPECNFALLRNVSLTFYCEPNVTIYVDQWNLQGGFVAFVGPPAAPWNITDVAVIVVSSIINATAGPAVGVVLGLQWSADGVTKVPHFAALNVSLIVTGSTLQSRAYSASALGCTLSDPGIRPTVTVWALRLFSEDSTLFAYGGAVATAAAIGIVYATDIVASQSHLSVLRSSVIAVAQGPNMGVAAIAGIVAGDLSATGAVLGCDCSVSMTNASSVALSSGSQSGSASTVGGIAIGTCISILQVNDTLLLGLASTMESRASAGASAYAASSVAGIAIGSASDASIRRSVHSLSRCNATSMATGTGSSKVASGVGAIAVGYISSTLLILSSSFKLSNGNATCTAASASSPGSASVAGISVGSSGSFVTLLDNAQEVISSWCNSTCTVPGNAYCAADVGGVSVGSSTSDISINDHIQLLLRTSALCVVSSSISSCTACGISGFSIGLVDRITISNTTQRMATSNVSSTCIADKGSVSSCTAGGVAVGLSHLIQIDNSTQWMLCSNATSTTTCVGTACNTCSSVAGIGLGQGSALTAQRVSHHVSNSIVTSVSVTGTGSNSGSSVVGVAVGYSPETFEVRDCTQTLASTVATCYLSTETGGAAVAGVAVGYGTVITVSGAKESVMNSTALSSSLSGSSGCASSVAGISLGYSTARLQVDSCTLYVADSNATSISASGSAASTVAGVAAGSVSTLLVGNSTSSGLVNSNTSSSADGSDHGASSIAGVVVGSLNPVVASTVSVSASSLFSCARAPSRQNACGAVVDPNSASSLCCVNTSSSPETTITPRSWDDEVALLTADVTCEDAHAVVDPRQHTLTQSARRRRGHTRTRDSPTYSLTPSASSTVRVNRHLTRRRGNTSAHHLHLRTATRMLPNRVSAAHSTTVSLSRVVAVRIPRLTSAPPVERQAATTFGTAGQVVVAAAYGSAAIAASLSPTAANKPAMVARAVNAATCHMEDGNSRTFPSTDPWALLPSVLSLPDDHGSSTAAGSVLSTLVVMGFCMMCSLVVPARRRNEPPNPRTVYF